MGSFILFCTPLKGKWLDCMIKLIATDMDGTFLDSKGEYSKERLLEVLELCRKANVLFVVASGRSMLTLERLFADVASQIAFVAENGAFVKYQERTLYAAEMPKTTYTAILEHLATFPDCRGALLSGQTGAYAQPGTNPAYVSHVSRYYDNVQLLPVDQVSDHMFKLTTKFSPETVNDRTQAISQKQPDVVAVTTGFDSMDIILKGIDKGFGLSQLCQALGILPSEVVAFGDNANDLELLTFAGLGIAVENAVPSVKEVADIIIGHHDDGAVLDKMTELLKNIVKS